MLRFLIEKEFKQIFRNSFLPRMIVGYPIVMLLIMPWAANFEIKNINFTVIDHDHSSYSSQLIRKIDASHYFKLTAVVASYEQGMSYIESDQTDLLLEIPRNFEKELVNDQAAKLSIVANAVNGTKGGVGSAYLNSIVGDFAATLRQDAMPKIPIGMMPMIEVSTQNRFNINLHYTIFMVPALMVMILTMLSGFLPALNIVGEKEMGTMEQINVTPVPRFTFIFAKLAPYWLIGFFVITVAIGLAYLVYNLVPAGPVSTLYVCAAIYILAISGLGLMISNYSDTLQQAMFVMFFFMLLMILVSGLFTPVQSMPVWAQRFTIFNPLKHFVDVMRAVYLKGSSLTQMPLQVGALLCFAVGLNTWAVLSYRKKN